MIKFIRNQKYSTNQKMLFLLLQTYAKNNIANISHHTLSNDLNLSRSTIIRTLNDLKSLGAIYVINQLKVSGRKTIKYYALADIDNGNFLENDAIRYAKYITEKFYHMTVEGK